MIEQMEMLRDMHRLENPGEQPRASSPKKNAPNKKKEALK